MKKIIWTIIILIGFTACLKNTSVNQGINSPEEESLHIESWHSLTLERWKEYNLYTTNLGKTALVNVEFRYFIANDAIIVYDFNNENNEIGLNEIGLIEEGMPYLGFAVTRFTVEQTDRNWTWFLVIKYQEGTGFWDGIIKITQTDFYEYIKSNMLFMNLEYRKPDQNYYRPSKSVVYINILDRNIPVVYFIDNIIEAITIMDANNQYGLLQPILEEYYISLSYDGIQGENEYLFSIRSDEILLGNIIWNVEINEIEAELIRPINLITGREL